MDLPRNYESMTPRERKETREEYIRIQNGKCYYCGSDLASDPRLDVQHTPVKRGLFPSRFFDWPVHLHHDKKSGMTIGAVHAHCNAVLWQYEGE